MKTVTKIAKKRYTIPVLNTVKVDGDRFTATDLDTWLSDEAPIGVEPGLYHGEGFAEGLRVKSNIPVADFPDMQDKGDLLGTVTLTREDFDKLAWVSLAMSTETTRYYLNGICFKGNRAIATDGHRLNIGEFETEFPAHPQFVGGVILPRDAFAYLALLMKEKKTIDELTVDFYTKAIRFVVGSGILISKYIDGTFPAFEMVIPQHDKATGTPFDPAEIEAILPEIKTRAKIADHRGRTNAVRLNGGTISTVFYGEHNGKWSVSSKINIEIGFDANLLVAACAGTLLYGDPTQPIVIEGDGRKAVVMPLRV